MAVNKYDVLSALIDSQAKEQGDPTGWHHLLVGVVDELSIHHGSEEDLSDAIYDRIASGLLPEKEEESENQVDQT